MLSPAVTISTEEPSSYDGEGAEASAPLQPPQAGAAPQGQAGQAIPCWLLFRKPLLALGVGTLLFGSGTALSLLYFSQVGGVPYLLGPLLLSVGLIFLATGLVWIPVLKQSQEHRVLTKLSHGKQAEHKPH